MKQQRLTCLLLTMLLLLVGCAPLPSTTESPPTVQEGTTFVKAVWIPYMEVRSLLRSEDVTAAIADCMQDCADRGFNTVYFHVRAHSDAYYLSEVFSPHTAAAEVLAQDIDPLAVAVTEAHARGLQLHAWVNPYRIGVDPAFAACDDVFEYNGCWYYIPTSSAVQTLITQGVRELVDRYAIDGVQFDDYFYPEGAVTAAPAAFEKAVPEGAVADWRRAHVTALIEAVYDVCHRREGCVFGVSPSYDIVRNRDRMYADIAAWAKNGCIDYLCPQLYVGFQNEYAPFSEAMVAWENLECAPSVALIGGLALYKTGLYEDEYAGTGRTEWSAGGDIVARQATLIKEHGWQGMALYSHLSFKVTDERDAAVAYKECLSIEEFLQ